MVRGSTEEDFVRDLIMKFISAFVVLVAVLPVSRGLAGAGYAGGDPCAREQSNAGQRICYTRAQTKVTIATDLEVKERAAEFLKQAQDPSLGPGVTDEVRKAASALTASQKLWKAYRARHCNAVAHSYTTGSGAGTAEEKCLFRLAQERLQELQTMFK
jgi:uncharacterized protein YecT (DUF1311 family)